MLQFIVIQYVNFIINRTFPIIFVNYWKSFLFKDKRLQIHISDDIMIILGSDRMLLYAIVISIIVIALLLMIYIVYYNKYQFAIIRMNEAENQITKSLKEKLSLIERLIPIFKEKFKKENRILDIVIKIKDNDLNNFELSKELQQATKIVNELLDNNVALYEEENIKTILDALFINKQAIEAGEKYYNDTVVTYNKLICSFPSNIVKLFMGLKRKEFYEKEKEEIYEILKEND